MKTLNRSLLPLVLCVTILIGSGVATAADVYQVTVSREAKDLYKVQFQETYIKTRYCYEYVHFDEAILRIDSPGGFNIGLLIFSNGNTCDVERLLS